MNNQRKGSFQDLNALFVFGALSVLMIHILGFFIQEYQQYPWNYDLEALLVILLRFGRSLFIFATGMLLFYWYKHRKVDWALFWRKRWTRIVVPYLIWTAIYTFVMHQTFDLTVLFPAFAESIVTGSSFYHLYYIPLYLQINLLFFLGKEWLERYLGFRLVAAAFLLQIGIYLLFHFLFVDPVFPQIDWNASFVLSLVKHGYVFGQSYAYMYLFYFLLGAYAGLHIDSWRTWVYRLRYVSLAALLVTAALIIGRYVTGRTTYEESLDIFAPLYFLYTTSFIAAFYPLSSYLGRLPALSEWLASLAKHNMAIYLVHPLILFLLESFVIFRLDWPTPAYIIAMFVITPPLCIFIYEHMSVSFWNRRPRKPRQKQSRPVVRTHQA
jgi:surface polysaccharide O-acyltransferase-like enzyme